MLSGRSNNFGFFLLLVLVIELDSTVFKELTTVVSEFLPWSYNGIDLDGLRIGEIPSWRKQSLLLLSETGDFRDKSSSTGSNFSWKPVSFLMTLFSFGHFWPLSATFGGHF